MSSLDMRQLLMLQKHPPGVKTLEWQVEATDALDHRLVPHHAQCETPSATTTILTATNAAAVQIASEATAHSHHDPEAETTPLELQATAAAGRQ